MILIKDGRLVDPLSRTDEVRDIVIEDDIVKYIGKFHKRSLIFSTIPFSRSMPHPTSCSLPPVYGAARRIRTNVHNLFIFLSDFCHKFCVS